MNGPASLRSFSAGVSAEDLVEEPKASPPVSFVVIAGATLLGWLAIAACVVYTLRVGH